MAEDVFKQYERKFGETWPKLIAQDQSFVKHCIDKNLSIDDLPDDDPYIKKYYSEDIVYWMTPIFNIWYKLARLVMN